MLLAVSFRKQNGFAFNGQILHFEPWINIQQFRRFDLAFWQTLNHFMANFKKMIIFWKSFKDGLVLAEKWICNFRPNLHSPTLYQYSVAQKIRFRLFTDIKINLTETLTWAKFYGELSKFFSLTREKFFCIC